MDPMEVRAWWERARPTMSDLLPHVIAQIEPEAARLDRLMQRSDETVFCFLGASGIGKSTLINALVADAEPILPAGGTGPLTAIATQVRFSEQKYFRVRYQPPAKLQGMRLNLERMLQNSSRASGQAPDTAPVDPDTSQWLIEPPSDGPREEPGALLAQSERRSVMIRAAESVVFGAPRTTDEVDTAGLAKLIAGLRCALGLDHENLLDQAERERLREVATALSFARTNAWRTVGEGADRAAFAHQLNQHAAGALAPLVAEIEVGWPAEFLRGGVVLVDLPGLGIAGDDYQRVTEEYIGRRARGVILTVRRGITEQEVGLLRSSGFWRRKLLAAADPEADPCDLIVAVTQVDSLVATMLRGDDDTDTDISRYYQDIGARVEQDVRKQTTDQLGTLSQASDDDADIREAGGRAARTVLSDLTVHPVSAVDYGRLKRPMRRLPAIAPREEDTGIPALIARIAELGTRNSAALRSLREASAQRLVEMAEAAIDQEHASLSEGHREQQAIKALREELARFLEPLRLEYATRQGQFHEFLENTSLELIGRLVGRAQAEAQKRVVRYLAELGSTPWATLRAAVVRGGAFHGKRKIDLADDLA